ncbi:MAG: hypothetical protein PUB09_00575 [Firmicutes bacterium]|nr:hypothetical protein [Bacillota bacterium]
MDLMQQFANPETIGSLSFGDKMLASLLTMGIGLGITFLVLIIIWIFIDIMAFLVRKARRAKLAYYEFTRLEPAYVNMHPELEVEYRNKRRRVSNNVSSKGAGVIATKPISKPKQEESPEKKNEVPKEELVAVISAAIAAFEGENANNLVVTKITRRANGQTPWTVAGLNERMETRKIL